MKKYGLFPWVSFKDATHDLESIHYSSFSERHLPFYNLLGPGQNWKNLTPEQQKEAIGNAFNSGGGKTGFFRRLAWELPSPTLVTSPTMPATALAHPELPRPLSVEEYKRLQCFPDNWQISGGIKDQYRQLGNAVPVLFGRAVGEVVLKHKDGSTSIVISKNEIYTTQK